MNNSLLLCHEEVDIVVSNDFRTPPPPPTSKKRERKRKKKDISCVRKIDVKFQPDYGVDEKRSGYAEPAGKNYNVMYRNMAAVINI